MTTKHVVLEFNSLRNVTPPEEEKANRKRYCGNASAGEFFAIPDHMNIRDYLQTEVNGKPIKKSTLVNDAMRSQLEGDRSLFPILNGGITIVASAVTLDDKEKRLVMESPSIINGSQTRGVLKDYFEEFPPSEDNVFPSVDFEVIVCTDERVAAEIAIARNYQNAVQPLSTYGARMVFKDLEAALRKRDANIRLRKSETDVGPEFWDTEKIIQVVTAMIPASVKMPRPLKGKGGSDGIRVYPYAGKAVCLKDFAEIQAKPTEYPDAKTFFEDVAYDAWMEFKKLRSYQGFSVLRAVTKVKGEVAEDGVPTGIIFPMISALGKLAIQKPDGHWTFAIPSDFDMDDLCKQAKTTYQQPGPGRSNPQTMGKELACYLNLHAIVDSYLKYRRQP
jgi:hypothetical protein